MVGAAGIEPATTGLEIRCSIRLSYAPTLVFFISLPASAAPEAVQNLYMPQKLESIGALVRFRLLASTTQDSLTLSRCANSADVITSKSVGLGPKRNAGV